MDDKLRKFVAANEGSPVVSAAWLDADKREPQGPPETWMFIRYRLVDGQTFTLSAAELDSLVRDGWEPDWGLGPVAVAEQVGRV